MKLLEKNTHYSIKPVVDNPVMGIVGKRQNNTDYSLPLPETRNSEKRAVEHITGITQNRILFLEQVHEDTVVLAEEYPVENSATFARADSIITPLRGLCPVIRTADCVPLFIYDPVHAVLAAVHSGWRGTQMDIAGKTVSLMREQYRSSSADLRAYILPSIGPQSYEIQQDVARHFPACTGTSNGRMLLDLWACISDSLVAAGVPAHAVENARICCYENNEDFFSHRRGDIGRNLNFAYMQ